MTKEATSTERALKLALEALELNDAPLNNETVVLWEQKIDEAIIALREALTSVPDWASEAIEQPAIKQDLTPEQPAQQEPVAWRWRMSDVHPDIWNHSRDAHPGALRKEPLYTSPPAQREPLPPEWINDCVREAEETTAPDSDFGCFEWLVRKVEAAHGIKENT